MTIGRGDTEHAVVADGRIDELSRRGRPKTVRPVRCPHPGGSSACLAEMWMLWRGVRTMRDPDLVKRAERAATALERAWTHWRTMHGLGSDPLPPVSSYVGYSLEEPWGQPRVVFGVGAEEAEIGRASCRERVCLAV